MQSLAHPASRRQPRRLHQFMQILALATGLLLALLWLFPIYWMLVTSITPKQLVLAGIQIIPTHFTFENYQTVFADTPVVRWFVNSLVTAVSVVAGSLALGSMAGYALARMHFPGRTLIFWLLVSSLMIPPEMTIVPLYITVLRLRVQDSYWGLILPPLASVFSVYLYRQFFLAFPRELEDAAAIDGCNRFGTFGRVVLPLAQPATLAGAILIFTSNWNAFLWPLLIAFTEEWKTLPVGMAVYTRIDIQGTSGQTGYGEAMAAVAIVAVPTLIFFLLMQRHFIQGITQVGIKG
jgi:multiple sugar transport system permease protein